MLKLQQERIRRGWTREELGKVLGVSDEAIRLYEQNLRKPSYPLLCRLEDILGMTHRELFSEAEGEQTEPG